MRPARLAPLVAIGWLLMIPASGQDDYTATTTTIPPGAQYTVIAELPRDQLEIMLKPLTQAELEVEAQAWLDELRRVVTEISKAELEAKRTKQAAGAKVEAENVNANEAEEVKKEAQDVAAEKLTEATKLREMQQKTIDRLNVVLAELDRKGGDSAPFKQYVTAVSGIKVDVSDMQAAWLAITGWMTSKEGGIRVATNIGLFLLTLIAFWIAGAIVASMVGRALRLTNLSSLLKDFLRKLVRRGIVMVGLVMALAQLEFDIGPLVAAIAGAAFVVGFALQGTLSNFASGLMILLYRPFDVDDAVTVAGVSGNVKSMSLVSTTIRTFDNQTVVIPNNSIWGDVITNITGNPTRRVDMTFGIGYADDIDKARTIIEEILQNEELVLADPAPVVRMHELADSSVNFVVRPWAKTSDYWAVYWEVHAAIKKRFDAEGISIPFPQRDVWLHQPTTT